MVYVIHGAIVVYSWFLIYMAENPDAKTVCNETGCTTSW